MNLEELVGETLSHIDLGDKYDEILLTTQSGRQIRICHHQDCFESVRIEDTEGDWHELIGKPLLVAEHDAEREAAPPPEYPDSWTRTTLTFKVDGATVISRWIGESNGYYSESVDIDDLGVRQGSQP